MSDPLYSNDMYEIKVIEDALDEDNRSRVAGYGIFNIITGIREATGLVFGDCRWRADQYKNMLEELDERANATVDEIAVVDEDVI